MENRSSHHRTELIRDGYSNELIHRIYEGGIEYLEVSAQVFQSLSIKEDCQRDRSRHPATMGKTRFDDTRTRAIRGLRSGSRPW